jgi:hypothetical protein
MRWRSGLRPRRLDYSGDYRIDLERFGDFSAMRGSVLANRNKS